MVDILAVDRSAWVGTHVHVPTARHGSIRYANLDNAATTPPLTIVRDTVDRFLDWYASVHRGSGFTSRLSTEVDEQCRAIVAGFVGADPADQAVVFTRSVTQRLNLAAAAIPFHIPGAA